jgi:hypothetical protein
MQLAEAEIMIAEKSARQKRRGWEAMLLMLRYGMLLCHALSLSCTFCSHTCVCITKVTGRGGLWGCKMLRIPPCLDSRLTDGGKIVSPTHQPHFTHALFFMLLVPISVRG